MADHGESASLSLEPLLTVLAWSVLLAVAGSLHAGEVLLCADSDCRGDAVAYSGTTSQNRFSRRFDDKVSSVSLSSPSEVVILYERPLFGGRALVLRGQANYNLADYDFDNCTSSIRILDGRRFGSLLELLAALTHDRADYYELKGVEGARRVAELWKNAFVVGNQRECYWEYIRAMRPQNADGVLHDPVISAKLHVRHCRTINDTVLYDVAVAPRFECKLTNRCRGLTLDFGEVRLLNLHVKVPTTSLVRFLESWK